MINNNCLVYKMGFRSWIGKAVGSFGNVLRKVGDFSSAGIRKIGEFSAPVTQAASNVARLFGQDAIASGINKVGDYIQKYSPAVEGILSRVSGVGQLLQGIGNVIGG